MALWIQCLIKSNNYMSEVDYLLNTRNVHIERVDKWWFSPTIDLRVPSLLSPGLSLSSLRVSLEIHVHYFCLGLALGTLP